MISLCHSCGIHWSLGAVTFPNCGSHVHVLDQRSYTTTLIGALHPDAQTVTRIATILPKTAPDEAYRPLEHTLWHYWREPYLAAANVEALGSLDSADARTIVKDALGHESLIVRAAAAKALQRDRTVPHTPSKG